MDVIFKEGNTSLVNIVNIMGSTAMARDGAILAERGAF